MTDKSTREAAKRPLSPTSEGRFPSPQEHSGGVLQAILETQNQNFLKLLNTVRATSAAALQNISVTLHMFNVPVKQWI